MGIRVRLTLVFVVITAVIVTVASPPDGKDTSYFDQAVSSVNGAGTLRCRVEAGIAITVRDHGPGFPDEFLPHAFERFRRADDSRSRDAGGSGLGLAIVATIVRAHHGTVTAGNCPDGGAAIVLVVPDPTAETPVRGGSAVTTQV